jgi:hypothetical protein
LISFLELLPGWLGGYSLVHFQGDSLTSVAYYHDQRLLKQHRRDIPERRRLKQKWRKIELDFFFLAANIQIHRFYKKGYLFTQSLHRDGTPLGNGSD